MFDLNGASNSSEVSLGFLSWPGEVLSYIAIELLERYSESVPCTVLHFDTFKLRFSILDSQTSAFDSRVMSLYKLKK